MQTSCDCTCETPSCRPAPARPRAATTGSDDPAKVTDAGVLRAHVLGIQAGFGFKQCMANDVGGNMREMEDDSVLDASDRRVRGAF